MKQNHLKFIRSATVDNLTDLAFAMIENHPETAELIMDRMISSAMAAGKDPFKVSAPILSGGVLNLLEYRFSGGIVKMSPEEYSGLGTLSKAGNKVQAIKELRNMTSLGLKEAKDFVEEHWFK